MALLGAEEILAPLSPCARERLNILAAADTANRMARGSTTYILMFVILAISSHAYSEHPGLMCSVTAMACISVIFRMLVQKRQSEVQDRSPKRWRQLTIVGVATLSACIGTLYGSFIFLYGYERWTFVVVMVWITGTAAGALIKLTADLALLRLYIFLNFTPAFVASLYVGGVQGYCYAFAVAVFVLFLLGEGRYLHNLYWQQLVARELEAQRNQELDDARRAAEQASKAKSQFLANMSHEIRTPMHGVLGVVDLLLGTELTQQQRQLLEVLNSSAEGLLHVINDVLDLSKVEAGKLTLESIPVDLRALARDVEQVVWARAQARNVELKTEVDEALPAIVLCDPVRLRQVLINLLGNAIKFTDEGTVRLRVSVGESEDPTRSRILFRVTDTGIGIPNDKLASIFEAFSQADGSVTRRFGGTGLGLAISSQIVSMMGSSLDVESEVGKGSTFSFVCDLERSWQAPVETKSFQARPDINGFLHILVAEDNPVNQMIVKRALGTVGHTVVVANNGREAVDAALAADFDVILMDDQMPDLTGIEATKLIKAQRPQIPIIAVSANAMEGDRERFLSAGMDGYVSKPFRLPELLAAMDACIKLAVSGIPT